MKAIIVAEHGGPEVLQYTDVEAPAPSKEQLLIDVSFAGINFIDTYFRSGLYPRETPFISGTEVCGTIAAVGRTCPAFGRPCCFVRTCSVRSCFVQTQPAIIVGKAGFPGPCRLVDGGVCRCRSPRLAVVLWCESQAGCRPLGAAARFSAIIASG